MAQIQSPETYVDGQQVTAARLNNQTNGAVLLPGAVTDQTAIASGSVATGDTLIVHDLSASALRKATAGELLGSGIPIITGSIAGSSGADIVVTPAAGQKLDVNGLFEADTLGVTGNSTLQGDASVGGTLTVGGNAAFNTTGGLKIPVGTTAQRPGTPVAGQMRYNSTLDQAEIYSGTDWRSVGGLPFDASGGVITTVDGYRVHTFTASGTFTPSLSAEGKVEVLVVGGGGGGGINATNVGAGGGGGGGVTYGTLFIARNTSPMSVVVGTGGAVGSNGSASSFSTFTANGGTSPGNTGTSVNPGGASGGSVAGVGGGGHGTNSASPGSGQEGLGSRLSMTNVTTYGGGGGGGGGNTGSTGGTGVNGGGYGGGTNNLAVPPRANSGGGGGGASSAIAGRFGTAGADGIVIIRYRVS